MQQQDVNTRWIKLGKIYDPAVNRLPFGDAGFAQSPQALDLNDRVRIYFSTRTRDVLGKYLSNVAYVDFDKTFSRMLGVSQQPVIELGELGTFDEHGIFPFNVLDDGHRILGFSTGWNRRVSVPIDAAVGLSVSTNNGTTFNKFGTGPILAPSTNEPFLVGDAFVRFFDGSYHMWYIHGVRWIEGANASPHDRVYKIAHAVSNDAIEWRRDGVPIIADSLGADECQALPTVVWQGGRYHMLFCYRAATDFRTNPSRAYRIGHASSVDLQHWLRDDSAWNICVSPEGWDSEMLCYPHLFQLGSQTFLLYNGNGFGRDGFGLAKLGTTA
jgi:hypothetical protein